MMHFNKIFSFSFLFAGFLWLSQSVCVAQSLNWTYENILDDVQESGENPDMVIGANGDLHVSFWNNAYDYLVYAKRAKTTGNWTSQIVDSSPSGYKSSIQIDNNGKVHIAYLRNENGTCYLSYANNINGTWVTEQLTNASLSAIGSPDFGPYGREFSYYYLRQPSVDMVLQSGNRPFISCFDGSIFGTLLASSGACEYFGFNSYDLSVFNVWKDAANQWKYERLESSEKPALPSTYVTCWLNGDRTGEFAKIMPKSNGSGYYLISNAIANKAVVAYQNTNSTFQNWSSVKIDEATRFQSPYAGNFTEEINKYSTFEHIDYAWANDSIAYLVYGYSDFYGEGSSNKRATAFLARVQMDKLGTAGYTPTYHDFNPGTAGNSENRDGIYRNNFGIAVRAGNSFTQQDTIYIAYSDAQNIKIQYSFNNGVSGSWVEQTLASNIPTRSPLQIKMYEDSVFVSGFNSVTNQLFMAKKPILGGTWQLSYVTLTEERGFVFDSEVLDSGGNEQIYTVFDEKYTKKLYLGQKINGSWSYKLIETPSQAIKYANIAIKPTGEPVVIYSTKGSAGVEILKAAYKNGNSWIYDTLDLTAYPREFSTAMNGSKLYAAYYDALGGQLKYATADLTTNSPNWTTQIIDSSSFAVGRNPSIFVSNGNKVHISYLDIVNNRLHYALKNGASAWVIDTAITPTLNSPTFSQVNYNDTEQVLRIGYKDEAANKLKIYVRWNDGVHTVGEVVEGTATVIGSPFKMLVTQSSVSNMSTVWFAYNEIIPGSNSAHIRIARNYGSMWNWIELSINNNIGLVGGSFGFNRRGNDFYLIGKKTDPLDLGLGMLYATDATVVSVEPQILEAKDILLYPNPSENVAHFQLSLPQTQEVQFDVWDIQGQNAGISLKENIDAGKQTRSFSTEHLTNGIYICRWQIGNQVITKKLMILK